MKQYYLQGSDDKCKVCGKRATSEGYDPCLGELCIDLVMNACCGHEEVESAYIQFWDGQRLSGETARNVQQQLKTK